MSSNFVSMVLKISPEWSFAKPFYYQSPVEHILCGFCLERTSSVAYIVGGGYPLYSLLPPGFNSMHLSYSERLDEINLYKLGDYELAEKFVQIANLYNKQISGLGNIKNFTERFKPLDPREDRDIIRRRIYIMNMIMLDEEEVAKSELESLLGSIYLVNNPRRRNELQLNELTEAFSAGYGQAKKLLLKWEEINKKKFKIK